jgi:hypothetical protein
MRRGARLQFRQALSLDMLAGNQTVREGYAMITKLPPGDRKALLYALSDLPRFTTVRGRQTIVRNALGGYELSNDVGQRLRWLDWEGGAIEVADALIQLFDGCEPAPGVPALGLIAQAIEPLVEPHHQDELVDMRRRLGWGADLAPATPDAWRDRRPPAEVVRERIIGEDTLRPIYYLHMALRAVDAVVRIAVPGIGKGTGFLVAPDIMMTNNHVIRVAIIQHPGGHDKKISMQNNLVAYADDKLVQYYTSTQAGSSGAPVLDDDFAVVAIHHGAVQDKSWEDSGARQRDPKRVEDLQWRNQGTSMIAVRDRLKAQAPGLLAEMTIL